MNNKKWVCLLLALVLCLAITGCNKEEPQQSVAPAPTLAPDDSLSIAGSVDLTLNASNEYVVTCTSDIPEEAFVIVYLVDDMGNMLDVNQDIIQRDGGNAPQLLTPTFPIRRLRTTRPAPFWHGWNSIQARPISPLRYGRNSVLRAVNWRATMSFWTIRQGTTAYAWNPPSASSDPVGIQGREKKTAFWPFFHTIDYCLYSTVVVPSAPTNVSVSASSSMVKVAFSITG